MKKINLIVIFLVFFFLAHTVGAQAVDVASLTPGEDYFSGQIVVKYKDSSDPQVLQQAVNQREEQGKSFLGALVNRKDDIISRLGGRPTPEKTLGILEAIQTRADIIDEKSLSLENTYVLTSADSDISTALTAYQASDLVEYAEPNIMYQPLAVPNDANYNKLWGLKNMQMEAAWDQGTGATSVIAAVVDTGVERIHPDLSSNVIETRGFANHCDPDHDLGGHGTHVAGTIGGIGNNNIGVVGVNWQISLLGYCVLGRDTETGNTGLPMEAVAEAINAAVTAGAKVINLSLGGPGGVTQTMRQSIQSAVQNGTVIVAAAGNTPGDNADVLYPASDPNVITVSALGPNNEFANYSSSGQAVDVSAPGGNPVNGSSTCKSNSSDCILSTVPGGRYSNLAGTSMAAPHVTGLVAMLFAKNSALTPQQIKEILQSTATDLGSAGWDKKFGYGIVNAAAAVAAAAGNPPPANSPTPIPTTAGQPTQSPTAGANSPTPDPRARTTTGAPATPTPGTVSGAHPCPDKAALGNYDCNQVIDDNDRITWEKDFKSGKVKLAPFFEWIRRALYKNS